jgi:acetolactate synthase small subunit
VKWYSLRKLFKKYRLPLLSISSQTADLKDQLENITKVAKLVNADLEANNVKSNVPAYSSLFSEFQKILAPSTAIKYCRVPIQRSMLALPRKVCRPI